MHNLKENKNISNATFPAHERKTTRTTMKMYHVGMKIGKCYTLSKSQYNMHCMKNTFKYFINKIKTNYIHTYNLGHVISKCNLTLQINNMDCILNRGCMHLYNVKTYLLELLSDFMNNETKIYTIAICA